jgi:A/G-specific adenine glycosylase
MMEVPSTDWNDAPASSKTALRSAPVRAEWWPVIGVVSHTFTHFRLELTVYRAVVPPDAPLDLWADPDRCHWVPRRALDKAALPSVMRKVLAHAMGDG